MNNLAGHLVHYYDVGNFHVTIFKYTRALHESATTCMDSRQQFTPDNDNNPAIQVGITLYTYPKDKAGTFLGKLPVCVCVCVCLSLTLHVVRFLLKHFLLCTLMYVETFALVKLVFVHVGVHLRLFFMCNSYIPHRSSWFI